MLWRDVRPGLVSGRRQSACNSGFNESRGQGSMQHSLLTPLPLSPKALFPAGDCHSQSLYQSTQYHKRGQLNPRSDGVHREGSDESTCRSLRRIRIGITARPERSAVIPDFDGNTHDMMFRLVIHPHSIQTSNDQLRLPRQNGGCQLIIVGYRYG